MTWLPWAAATAVSGAAPPYHDVARMAGDSSPRTLNMLLVAGVTFIIWLGVFLYMRRLDAKIKDLQA